MKARDAEKQREEEENKEIVVEEGGGGDLFTVGQKCFSVKRCFLNIIVYNNSRYSFSDVVKITLFYVLVI